MSPPAIAANLEALYGDTPACAKLVGLQYVDSAAAGYARQKHGRGYRYVDSQHKTVTGKALLNRIAALVIPPAWQDVWICSSPNGHVLATGIDEAGRKQYIYHPKWRTMRDLIKFYRMITFAKALPRVRAEISHALSGRGLNGQKILGTMLWLLDNTYIRIGNEQYYQANESVGLTTLTTKNVVVAGSVATLSFKGKSGKVQQISFDNKQIARILSQLQTQANGWLFQVKDGADLYHFTPADINTYLHDISGAHISAKDFRTWGGTLMAFNHLIETEKLPDAETPKTQKVLVQAVDAAANVLGNTRSVARSSYVHPHLLSTYGSKNFAKYYRIAIQARPKPGLDKRETELLSMLEQLFQHEYQAILRKR